jgi:hypothetical protein
VAVVLLLAGCQGSGAPGNGGDGSDGDSDGDTDTDYVPGEYGLFDCPEQVQVPVEAVVYRDVNAFVAFYDQVHAVVAPWIDESCFGPCAEPGDFDECIEASCVTEAGATLEYEFKQAGVEGDYDIWDQYTTIVVIPPEGESWTSAELNLHRHGYGDGDEYSGTTDAFSLQWSGTLQEDFPDDFEVSGERYTGWDDDGSYLAGEWHHSGCDVSVDRFGMYSASWITDIEVDGHTVRVEPVGNESQPEGYNGFVDGECVGDVDYETWELVGPCL